MFRVLLGLILGYGLVVGAALTSGFWVHDRSSFAIHFVLGLFSTLFTCLLYCIVLTYFIITGKLVKNAVLTGGLDPDYVTRTQRLKGRVSGLIVLAVGASLLAALLGVAGQDSTAITYGTSQPAHLIAQCVALAFNTVVLYLTCHLVHHNRRLVEQVFRRLSESAHGP